jgi:beta-phosphoglucomutase-like phosphatase (HAD superfamily)
MADEGTRVPPNGKRQQNAEREKVQAQITVTQARGKPHPDIFLFAADKLGVRPNECLVIEDSTGGIRAAVAAGMTAIGLCAASHIRDGHDVKLHDAGAVHLAQSWSEVERFVDQLFKR